MPLARFAMHAQAEQVHIAAWPEVPDVHRLASRHYAFEGRCFVVCAGSFLASTHIPTDFEAATAMSGAGDFRQQDGVILPGGSGVIGPDSVDRRSGGTRRNHCLWRDRPEQNRCRAAGAPVPTCSSSGLIRAREIKLAGSGRPQLRTFQLRRSASLRRCTAADVRRSQRRGEAEASRFVASHGNDRTTGRLGCAGEVGAA